MPVKTRDDVPKFTKASIEAEPVDELWQPFWKQGATMMRRIDGPFRVKTREGWLKCEDGWLAIDAQGWPYPIDAAVQETTYLAEIPSGDLKPEWSPTLDVQDGWPWTISIVLLMGAAVGAAATILLGSL